MSINVYPNNYIIQYTDRKGNTHTTEMSGLTADEAMIRFRSMNMTAQNVAARIKPARR